MLHSKFKIIGHLVLGKKMFKGFSHIWAWRPSWSIDLDHLYKLSFPLPLEASYKILALICQALLEEKTFEIVDGRQTMTTDDENAQWTPDHGYPISSPMSLWLR